MKNFQLNDRVQITNTIATASGTLYQDQIVKVISLSEDTGNVTVTDDVGKIWHVEKNNIRTI